MSEIQSDLVVAIVGMGPRGLSVLERLLVRLAERAAGPAVSIWVFDPGEHGAGRIWRTDQPDWFLMNTPAGEVSMYSGDPDEGPPRAGAGPSLHEWLSAGHAGPQWSTLGANGYAPRSCYGKYLRDVFHNLVAHKPDNVTIHSVRSSVEHVQRHEDRMRLVTRSGRIVFADKLVLTTGHPRNTPSPWERKMLDHADGRGGLRYIRGDSAADLDLASVGAGERVGILGLGLTFLDVVMALTVGRGGVFEAGPSGEVRYRPSGREPRVYAGSRSGLPMLARGLNQKAPKYRYEAKFLTPGALAEARRRARRETGSAQLDFRRDVLPLLQLEVDHVYYTAMVRDRAGEVAADRFARAHLACAGQKQPDVVEKTLAEFGIAHAVPLDLERTARPFSGQRYADPAEFHRHVLGLLRQDTVEALRGNVHGPVKAALDILRDLRGAVRAAVDFGGLRPRSHREDFLGWFTPINTMVSAGPPALRLAQVRALIEAGVVHLVGPGLRVRPDQGGFLLDSTAVDGAGQVVTTLIDARIPRSSVRQDSSPLTRQLLSDGLICEYINATPRSDDGFATGAVSVTRAPFHAIGSDGRANPNLYVLGIPTENLRWFTQIGNGRPGPLSAFHTDADAIAGDVLARLRTAVAVPAADRFTDDWKFRFDRQPARPGGDHGHR
ncbi:FAD/NAD(P)-binding protein [Kibdelosporangium persicum]|uniref:Methylaspartate mutase epsilon subunit n=1 Tax=Kibdelosporangium persicum TaxID=2698649 RepID=A0ABX2FHX9_9PSEU|nr:FAD/NAD(P)-binding protein [Kibdelosporangium persicum]NRN70348.1 Methylaspartate mutase epsilon subunit [Kibdelosporangium persicum]